MLVSASEVKALQTQPAFHSGKLLLGWSSEEVEDVAPLHLTPLHGKSET